MSKDIEDLLEDLGGFDDNEKEDKDEGEYISPMSVPVVYDEKKSIYKSEEDKMEDYRHARNTLYGLIQRGTTALEHALKVATETEHPRSLEVANNLMRNISEMSKQLIELQKLLKDIGPGENSNGGINIQQNYFTLNGNSDVLHDLMKTIDGMAEEIEEPPEENES